jgi:hypothetical protein
MTKLDFLKILTSVRGNFLNDLAVVAICDGAKADSLKFSLLGLIQQRGNRQNGTNRVHFDVRRVDIRAGYLP